MQYRMGRSILLPMKKGIVWHEKVKLAPNCMLLPQKKVWLGPQTIFWIGLTKTFQFGFKKLLGLGLKSDWVWV